MENEIQNNEEKENIKEIEKEKEDREYHYIYFNEIHDVIKEIKIEISQEYSGFNTLEIFDRKNPFELSYNSTTSLKIYRFKIYPDLFEKNNLETNKIKINIEQQNKKSQFIFNIENIDIHKDYYEYNFGKGITEIDFVKISYEQQIEIYNNFILNTLNKKQDSKENEEFILSTQKLIIAPDSKYTFYFYMLIFKKCLDTKLLQKHILLFDLEKLNGIGNFPEKELNPIRSLLINRVKKANEIIIDNEEQRPKIIQEFYFIIFVFNSLFNNNETKKMMNNKEIFENLCPKLLIHQKFFRSLILTNEQCNNLIEKAENLKQILSVLNYIGNNFLNLIKVINANFEKIVKMANEAVNKEKDFIIEMEDYATPNPKDNLEDFILPMNQLINKQRINEKKIIIKFTPDLFTPYIKYNVNNNLTNLIFLSEIISEIKKLEKNFKFTENLNEYIHITGLKLIEKGKLNNSDIFLLLNRDNYYIDKIYSEDIIHRSLKILDGIDIKTLNIDSWKKYDFKEIFKAQIYDFAKKIVSFINHMKDFGMLYELFKVKELDDIPNVYISELKRRYKELLVTYSAKTCPNFINDSAELINLVHRNKSNFKDFLKEMENLLDINMINKILIELSEKDISNDLKKKIVEYFTKNKKANPTTLIFLINNCKKLRKEIFQNMGKFIPSENDILSIEENDKFKLLKGLIDNKIIEKKDKKEKIDETYIMKTNELLLNLSNKLENYDISYRIINQFLMPENEGKFLDILYYIFHKDQTKSRSVFSKLRSKKNEVQISLNKYEKLLYYFNLFFQKTNQVLIKNLELIVSDITNNSLTTLEKKYKSNFIKYEKYYEEALKMDMYMRSIFFIQIFKEIKKQYENYIKEDLYYITEAKNKFNELKILFQDKDGISKLNPQILEICIKVIKENPEYLEQELRNLQEIFLLDEDENIFLDKLYDELLLLSCKDYIFNISVAIETFITAIKGKEIKTKFITDIKKIIKELKEKNKTEIIDDCRKKLEEYGINIGDENNEYISILLELKQNKESIEFLLNTPLENCGDLKELSLENNFVSTNDILDMEKCIEFLNNLGDIKQKTDIEIINIFKEKVSKNKEILLYFKKYVASYGQIKTLQPSLNNSENLKNQINAIFGEAIFEVNNENDKTKYFVCTYNIPDKDGNIELKRLYEEDIKNIRDRAILSKNNMTKEYRYLIDVINEIVEIHNIIREIYIKGYPKKLRIQIRLIKEKKNEESSFSSIYFYDFAKMDNPEDIKKQLFDILDKLNKYKSEAYEIKPLLRYFYGRKFNLLYNYIHNLCMNDFNFISFLKFITDDLYKTSIKKFVPEKSPDVIKDALNDCNKYLSELLEINNLSFEKIYSQTTIKKDHKKKFKGFYIYKCENLELNLFQINKYLTGNNPIAQNVLLCNKSTYKEEILTFMYRAINCEYNSCFIIGGVENLEYEQTTYMLDLFDSFSNKYDKINSCIIFLYTNKSAEICMNMELKSYKDILPIDENYKKEKYEKNDIEIIKSDKSGIGKSTQIQKSIENKGKKWIYFPFGDVLKRENIINRLNNLKIDSNCIIHLDLYDTDNISLMNEFLFSVLILRFYGKDEDVFYFSKDIEIKIEIPNSFINYLEKFKILQLFNLKEMKLTELSPLIVPKNIDSKIQIVSNYLKYLKEDKISDYDLIIPKITPESLIEISKKKIIYKKPKKYTEITAMDAQILSQEECQSLIFDSINIKNPTYYQITSFINILSVQFKKFNQNYFLNAHNLKITAKNIYQMRKYIIQNFIAITKYFTEGAFTNFLKTLEIEHKIKFGYYDRDQEKKDNENAINNLANDPHNAMSFKNINTTLVFFHEGINENFSIITNKNPEDQEYINFLELKNCQVLKKEEKLKYLPRFNDKNLEKKQFLEELRNILAVNNPITKAEKIKNKSNLKSFEEITENYVITPDNFIKMVLILLRIRSNIPVIMMGETGCGKTSLIRKLSELKNNGDTKKMKILNIHAGTNDLDIIDFIKKNVVPFAEELEYHNRKIKKYNEERGMLYEGDKLWVFLDEINTCKSMGLISELMCKHSYQGNKLPDNIVFIAACNPYRKKEKKGKNEEIGLDANLAFKEKKNLNEKEKEELNFNKNDLVYLVNPLPHSLLNFVFDFGGLEEDDEENYIRCIIEESIEKIFYKDEKIKNIKEDKKNNNKFKSLINFAQNMVIFAHKFIKKNSDRSLVSLREIRRFNIFYVFFYDYLQKRKKNIEEEKEKEIIDKEEELFYQSLDHFESQIYSVNLSIFLCYYLRITNRNTRIQFVKEINLIFKNPEIKQKKDFLEIPRKEEQFLVENIKLEKGIAKNRALLENIFSLFAALNSKVPIFIVGKPGCSKSLSFQLINKSMQAGGSESTFFRKYPKLLVNSFQGSMSSTSKSVENIFEKARNAHKQLAKEEKLRNISMIFFDEMGLAEHSPNNPLKVIHSKLEYDENEDENKISFLGISNWSLDAAKMNRGISIFIPDLSEEDNIETSLTIGKSYDENLTLRYEQIFRDLGIIYYEYKNYLQNNYITDGRKDFHGNRDFYHLIKIFAKNIIIEDEKETLNEDTLLNCAINSIERNFGGMNLNNGKSSIQKFKDLLNYKYPKVNIKEKYDVIKRAKENINDPNSRYLLLITNGNVSMNLISSILLEKREYCFYFGSKFKKDLNNEDYASRVINKIQVDMEKGNFLILKDLETIYPHLYDLFNQNFTVLSGKSYSRIQVGSSTNAYCPVNNNFKCIVNVDINKIAEEEAPFLNRFEKHIISFEDLLSKDLIDLSKEIYSKLSDLSICSEELISINYSLEKLLINCNLDEIQALIYKANSEGKKETEEIYDYILSKISLTLPQDIIISMIYGKFQRNYPQYSEKIIKFYKEGEHTNFANFIKKIEKNKNVVYTFSNKMEKIKIDDDIETKTKKIIIGMLKKDNELEKLLDEFYINDKYQICLIQLMPHEGEFMNYIKYLIESKEKKYKNKTKKCFIFIVHLLRVLNDEIKSLENNNNKTNQEIKNKILNETLTNLSEYYQIFIDNLNGDENIKIENIINSNNKAKFEFCFKMDEINDELSSALFTATSYIKYNIPDSYKGLNKDNYIGELTEYIQENKNLRDLINNRFYKELEKEPDIIIKILKNKNTKFSMEVIDIANLIKKELLNIYRSMIYILFFKLEKNQFFSALLSNKFYEKEEKKEEKKKKEINILDKISESYLDNLEFNDGILIKEGIKKNQVNILLGFRYPGIKPIIDKIIREIKESIINRYKKNEDNLRGLIEKEDEEEEIKKYYKILNIFDSYTINIINNEINLKNIIDNKNEKIFSEELFNLIKHDYFYYFLKKSLKEKSEEKNEIKEEEIIYDLEDSIKFMNIIYKTRNEAIKRYFRESENDKDLDIVYRLSKLFNYFESYYGEIKKINQMFLKLSLKIPNLYLQVEEIINKKEIKFEISNRNPEYSSVVNEAFFISVDSILRVIITNENIYNIKEKNSDEILYNLILTYNRILQNALSLNNELTFRSKEGVSLQEILNLLDAFKNIKMLNIENLIIVIKYFKKETRYNNEGDGYKLCQNFKEFCEFLLSIFEKSENKKFNMYKTMSNIFLNEYLKIVDKDFRNLLFEKILEKNELIKNSSQLFKILVENVVYINADDMKYNLDSILKNETSIWKIINNTKNEFLDEIFMNIFEEKIVSFFDSIPKFEEDTLKELYPQFYDDNKKKEIMNITGIIFDHSFDIFKEVIEFLDKNKNLDNQNNIDEENRHLGQLYSIVYIKYYLYQLVYIIKVHKSAINNRDKLKNIMNFIIEGISNSFSRVIKIYIFKLFYNFMDKNFEEFKVYDFKGSFVEFLKEFDSATDDNNDSFLTYFFLPLDDDDYSKYSQEIKLFDMCQKNNFKVATNDLAKLINEFGLDIFLTVSINKIISNLGIKTYIIDKEEYSNFSSFIKSLLDSNDLLTFKLKKLLYLFYDIDTYRSKTKKLLENENGEINQKIFEIILYGFRLCINTMDNKENENKYLYKSLLEKNYIEAIEKSYIPGIDSNEDLHLVYLDEVEKHMKFDQDSYGCYVCSCGYNYTLGPCGFPDKSCQFNCCMCQLPVGYAPKPYDDDGSPNHGMVLRDGHFRIFKNEEVKISQMGRFNENDENIPNMLYEDYLKKIIEPIRKKITFGFNSISRDYFENRAKKIRNLSNIGYRLLNFIAYSFLFFSHCLDNISKEKLDKYLIKDMNILKIIETDWNFLEEELKKKNINSIQIFMNMIFKKLSIKIKECKFMKKGDDREKFENDIEELISECINNYNSYRQIYDIENKNQLKISNYSFKSILNELTELDEKIYLPTEYPYFKYFIYTKYKTEEDFYKRMPSKEKYPLTNLMLMKIEEIKKLKYLPDFNEFTNLMLEEYSFKLSREEAKKRSLNKENIYKNENFKIKLKKFLKVWNKIKNDAIKYECRKEMPVKTLSDTDKLNYFLNDNGENGGGAYIAAAYSKFIEWQNSILQPIITANQLGGILYNYLDFIKKKICVQDAQPDQIVLIDKKIENSKYSSLKDIIYSFSDRNIFLENDKINYSDYNMFLYDYDSIEEELGRIILPGVCQFEDEKKLNFIVYWSEGFRGGNSDIICKFYEKYKQRDLTDEEKNKIKDYIIQINKEKMNRFGIKKDFKEILSSLQILLFFLIDFPLQKDDENINKIIKDAPQYFKISVSNDCREFFENVGLNLKVDTLMHIYFILEHLCFDELCKSLQNDLKLEINEETRNMIINELIKNYKNRIYSLKDLGAAVRRYISRYLVGFTEIIDIENTRALDFELSRQELWEKRVWGKDCDLVDILKRHIGDFKLQVSQAYKFYELIGNEDKEEVQFLNDDNNLNKINE